MPPDDSYDSEHDPYIPDEGYSNDGAVYHCRQPDGVYCIWIKGYDQPAKVTTLDKRRLRASDMPDVVDSLVEYTLDNSNLCEDEALLPGIKKTRGR